MSKTIVVSQPMFLPWVGLFQQVKAADHFVHYDDVQFPQGRSFSSRVQVKSKSGSRWLTVPVKRDGKKIIRDVKIDNSKKWKVSHIGLLHQCYRKAPFSDIAMGLVETIYAMESDSLSEFCIYGIERIADFLNLECDFSLSSHIGAKTSGSQRLLDVVTTLNGNVYITGHGAKNYLDHSLFESRGVDVEYMEYILKDYSQLHGEFIPYVTIIDLIAHVGDRASEFVVAKSINWKSFTNE